jgi:hypothetical protein
VPGPHPVVHLAAVLAHRLGRRVDETDVPDLGRLEEDVSQATVVGAHAASGRRPFLACRHQLLGGALDGGGPGPVVLHRGGSVPDLLGDVTERAQHLQANPFGGQLPGTFRSVETFLNVVVLGRGVLLDRSEQAMVIRDHESVGAHE